MPVHDWTRVNAGIFHHFHQRWISAISDCLNNGLLPPDYYALAEQFVGHLGPDVLAWQFQALEGGPANGTPTDGFSAGVQTLSTVAVTPPRVRSVAKSALERYARKQSTLVVRHSSGDRVEALIEVVSPGNKASQHAMRAFVQKAADALACGYHLLILDLQPPGPRDPHGIHGAIWEQIEDASYVQPAEQPLTLAAYSAGEEITAYLEPVAMGDVLTEMPLFLTAEAYVRVPLEETYQAAWQGVPRRWQHVLEGTG